MASIMKYFAFGLVALLLAFVVVTGGISYDVAWKLIHPARKAIVKTPSSYDLGYRAITFPSAVDHLLLSGWLIPAAIPSKTLVIEAHGYRENRSSNAPSLPVADALHKAGDAVLMFDFRAEGKSQGDVVSVGLYEQRDLRGAVAYAQKLGYSHIGVIGYSMGASTALEVASSDPVIGAVVADSPFSNLYKYLQLHMSEWTHLPNWPFTPEILWELKAFNNLNARLVDPEKMMARLGQRPIMLIAGTADKTIPMRNSESLYKALERDKMASLWEVKGAKHVGAYIVHPKQYLLRVTHFFSIYLQ